MIFQFLAEWKLERTSLPKRPPPTPLHEPRSSSITVDSILSFEHMDWKLDKNTWSFQKDYVSFPRLDTDDDDHQ
ncbi:hypothetical protein DM01DRAFT_1331378 [Hesseltinella vesiculosa]|uniref:Uncharacterized protein n=1 Tax=Hesseltinella vesiculosa TaxID=101127 RepID=A0A1X2GV46_9FUNG|nr:hypothetical protein DM01DRAFT_1331378 [Hesseltinella vesiculosa]